MTDRYNYYSEKAYLEKLLLQQVQADAENLLNIYLDHGLEQVFLALKVVYDWQKEIVQDFLFFDCQAVERCVKQHPVFFQQIIANGQGELIRRILLLDKPKYDSIWFAILEILNEHFVNHLLQEKLNSINSQDFFLKMLKKHPDLNTSAGN